LGCIGSWASIIGIPLAVVPFLLSPGDHTKVQVQTSGTAQVAIGNSNVQTQIQTQIVNNGISKAELQEMLKERFDTPNLQLELAKRYPGGYGLIGVANGTFIFQPKFKTFSCTADWEHTIIINDPSSDRIVLVLAHLVLQTPHSHQELEDVGISFPRTEHVPMPSKIVTNPLIWCEVLDLTNNIFVIGFK
jgi:hypothetical protein